MTRYFSTECDYDWLFDWLDHCDNDSRLDSDTTVMTHKQLRLGLIHISTLIVYLSQISKKVHTFVCAIKGIKHGKQVFRFDLQLHKYIVRNTPKCSKTVHRLTRQKNKNFTRYQNVRVRQKKATDRRTATWLSCSHFFNNLLAEEYSPSLHGFHSLHMISTNENSKTSLTSTWN